MSARIARSAAAWAVLSAVALATAVAPLRAQTDEMAATVLAADGEVSVIRAEQMWALFPGNRVVPGETVVTGRDGFAELELADGSAFLVYPDSRVVFRGNAGNLRDLLDLFLGRVKVYIRRMGGEPNPHRIFTPTAVISVRGTTFDVIVDGDETVTVGVEEGEVGVRHRLMPSNRETPVRAGESLTVHPTSPLAKARVDGESALRMAGDMVRAAASILRRTGGGSGGGAPGGGGGSAPLPGDEEAPAPPPAPPPQ